MCVYQKRQTLTTIGTMILSTNFIPIYVIGHSNKIYNRYSTLKNCIKMCYFLCPFLMIADPCCSTIHALDRAINFQSKVAFPGLGRGKWENPRFSIQTRRKVRVCMKTRGFYLNPKKSQGLGLLGMYIYMVTHTHHDLPATSSNIILCKHPHTYIYIYIIKKYRPHHDGINLKTIYNANTDMCSSHLLEASFSRFKRLPLADRLSITGAQGQ